MRALGSSNTRRSFQSDIKRERKEKKWKTLPTLSFGVVRRILLALMVVSIFFSLNVLLTVIDHDEWNETITNSIDLASSHSDMPVIYDNNIRNSILSNATRSSSSTTGSRSRLPSYSQPPFSCNITTNDVPTSGAPNDKSPSVLHPSYHHGLIIVFAHARTGSGLFLSLLDKLHLGVTSSTVLDLVTVQEVFMREQRSEWVSHWKVRDAIHQMAQVCPILPQSSSGKSSPAQRERDAISVMEWERQFWTRLGIDPPRNIRVNINDPILTQPAQEDEASTEEHTTSSIKSNDIIIPPWAKDLISHTNQGLENPKQLVTFLRRIPSTSPNSHIVMKIMPQHLYDMKMNASDFLDMVMSTDDAGAAKDDDSHRRSKPVQIFVIWRRRLIESYISLKIAASKEDKRHNQEDTAVLLQGRQSYVGATTNASDTITVDLHDLEKYVSRTKQYYRDIYDALQTQQERVMSFSPSIQYDVLEYQDCLSDPNKQRQTWERLIEVFHIPRHQVVEVPTASTRRKKLKKQAQVPVEQQVTNWHDIAELVRLEDRSTWNSQ